jgi:hypothetical protein
MHIYIAVLCLVAVSLLIVGCQGSAAKAPASSAKKSGPYKLDDEGFITNWLVVGPFPNPGEEPNYKGFDIDYLKEYGGEENYVPANGMQIAKDDGTKVKWAPFESTDGRLINFFSVEHLGLGADLTDNILTYSACWLDCENDMNVQIRVGSDDGYKLWIDHKLIGNQHVYRPSEQDQESYDIKLSKGMHLVLIKVDQGYGQFEFMMRVVTQDGSKASGIKVWN